MAYVLWEFVFKHQNCYKPAESWDILGYRYREKWVQGLWKYLMSQLNLAFIHLIPVHPLPWEPSPACPTARAWAASIRAKLAWHQRGSSPEVSGWKDTDLTLLPWQSLSKLQQLLREPTLRTPSTRQPGSGIHLGCEQGSLSACDKVNCSHIPVCLFMFGVWFFLSNPYSPQRSFSRKMPLSWCCCLQQLHGKA